MKQQLLRICLLILLAFFCGKDSAQPDCSLVLFGETDSNPGILSVEDSIGIEMGDSNYVFGSVRRVEVHPDGSILVLDWIKCTIFQFSPSGEFIRYIGRRGEGPGEFLQPGFM